MKKLFSNQLLVGILIIFLLSFSFFIPNLLKGKIPIPADALLGLYHPFRDASFDGYSLQKFPTKNPLITDPVLQTYPWRLISIKNLKSFKLPDWNPYSFSGQPLAGNIQSAPFSVFNIIYLLLPFNYGWGTQIILSLMLSSLFMFFFLKNQKLENKYLSNPAAIFGSITLAFSGFYIAWLEWNTIIPAALWLPLILLSIQKFFENGKSRWFIILIFAQTQSVLAGHAQTTLYVLIASLLYVIFNYFKAKNKPRLFFIICTYFLSFLIVLPQVLPALEFIKHSARSLDQGYFPNRTDWFIPPQNLIQLIVPDYFGNPATYNYWGIWNYGEFVSFIGASAFFFVLVAILSRKKKSFIFYIYLISLALLLGLKNPISLLLFNLNLPFISTLQPSRIIFLLDFSLCVISAFGLEIFITRKKRFKSLIPAAFLISGLIAIAIFTLNTRSIFPVLMDLDAQNIALRNMVLPITISILICIAVLLYAFVRKKSFFIVFIFALTIFELFRFSNKFLSFTKVDLLYPQTQTTNFLNSQPKPFRIITTDRRIMHPNISGVYSIESVDGYDPLYLKNYGQFISSWQANSFKETSNSFNRIITPEKIDGPLLNLLNIKYVLSFDELKTPGLVKVGQEGETVIYENTNVLGRLFFVDNIIKSSAKDEFNNLLTPSFITKNATSQEIGFSSMPSSTSVHITSYDGDEVKSEVSTQVAKPIVISNIFYPGWKAKIDGKDAKIFKVNSIFQAVMVPAGSHILELKYRFKYNFVSFGLSAFGILVAGFVSFYLWRKKYQ